MSLGEGGAEFGDLGGWEVRVLWIHQSPKSLIRALDKEQDPDLIQKSQAKH